MAKSNRRRKLDRAKRETSASQRRAAAERRRSTTGQIDAMIDLLTRICDPSTAVSELPGLIEDRHAGEPVPTWLVPLMLEFKATPERLAAVAGAMLAGPPRGSDVGAQAEDVEAGAEPRPSVTAQSFAAAVARARGDTAGCRRLLDQALAATSEPDDRATLIDHMRRAGYVAEAIELLEAALREDPADNFAAESYGDAIHEAFKRAHEQPPGDDDGCSCGLGTSWPQCCEPRERAALDRFADRSALIAVRDAVDAWLPDSDYGPAVDARVRRAVPREDQPGWDAADRAGLVALLTEHALGTARRGERDQPEADDRDADDDAPLAAFAAAPTTPAQVASRASAWREHVRYGLWRIDNTRPAPGRWCTEIVSGVIRYVDFPAELADDIPRWAVWLGAMVPVDGIWRCTGIGMRLSPTEADAAAQLVGDATMAIMERIAGNKADPLSPQWAREPMPFGDAEPVGVLVDMAHPAPPQAALLYGMVTGELLSRIAAEVYAYRAEPPALRNTDGEPLCLITAKIAVSDGPRVTTLLGGRTGFETDPDDPASIIWYGLQIPDDQAEARGTLRVVGDQIVADVNSARRLDRLIRVLDGIGANPSVVEEKQIDPMPDLLWPGDEDVFSGGAVTVAADWEKAWLDEPVSALRGHSPRQAVLGSQRPKLESLLRQWEYDSDLLAAEGKQGIDTGWLRQELGIRAYEVT
jgi:hypothetical protein